MSQREKAEQVIEIASTLYTKVSKKQYIKEVGYLIESSLGYDLIKSMELATNMYKMEGGSK